MPTGHAFEPGIASMSCATLPPHEKNCSEIVCAVNDHTSAGQ
jgi:hypothetical protein